MVEVKHNTNIFDFFTLTLSRLYNSILFNLYSKIPKYSLYAHF